jgi:hypothetical protein
VDQTSISFPLRPESGRQLSVSLQALLQTFAAKQKAERPQRWKSMEFKVKGIVLTASPPSLPPTNTRLYPIYTPPVTTIKSTPSSFPNSPPPPFNTYPNMRTYTTINPGRRGGATWVDFRLSTYCLSLRSIFLENLKLGNCKLCHFKFYEDDIMDVDHISLYSCLFGSSKEDHPSLQPFIIAPSLSQIQKGN